MKIKKKTASVIYFLKQYRNAWLPGILVMSILLVYTLIFNISLSYMGNTSDQAISMIVNNFLLIVIIILVKILLAYIVIGAVLNIIVFSGIWGFKKIRGTGSDWTPEFIPAAVLVFILVMLKFLQSLIVYPQLYTDTVYAKWESAAAFQRLLTDNVNPAVFSVLFWSIICISAFLGLSGLIVSRGNILKNAGDMIVARKWKLVSALLVIVAGAGLWLFSAGAVKADSSRPNILILSSDALRKDHFSANGYGRNTTPNIDMLCEKGVSFKNIYTTVPRTFPAWVSILTSRYPMYHYVRHMFPSSRARNQNFVTLATELRDRGYDTVVTGDFAADIFPRIELGYSRVYAPSFTLDIMIEQLAIKNNSFIMPFLLNRAGFFFFPGIRECAEFADPALVTGRIMKEIKRSTSGGRPFFITAFYSVTHFPYSAPWPYYNNYSDRAYTGPYKYLKNRIVELNDRGGTENVSTADIEQVRALYDGCLRAFDDSVGSILSFLREEGLLDNTIVIVLSDHGENLYENDFGMGHGEHLRGDLSLKIPFVIYWKKLPSKADVMRHRSSIDIAPTILEAAGFTPPSSFQGKSLFSQPGADPVYIETGLWFDTGGDYFFQKKRLHYPNITGLSEIETGFRNEIVLAKDFENYTWTAKHRAIIDGDYKLIYMPTINGIEYELYNVKNDPQELRDISGSEKEKLEMMKKRFFRFIEKDSNVIIKKEYIMPLFNDPRI